MVKDISIRTVEIASSRQVGIRKDILFQPLPGF